MPRLRTVAAFLACSAVLVLSLGVGSATADGSDAVGTQFSIDGNSYTIMTLADETGWGSVQLSSADQTASTLTIPAQVQSPASGASYTVANINFAAFNNRSELVSLTLPSSVTDILAGANGAFFSNCTSLESVGVSGTTGDDSLIASDDGVLYACTNGKKATLLIYPQRKSDASFTVPKTVSTIAPYAFSGNENLRSVSFQSGLEGESSQAGSAIFSGGIRTSAFESCTALESVSFPHEARIGTVLVTASSAIGNNAFKDCTSLKSLSIPAITTAEQKATAYQTFEELNPGSTLTVGTTEVFTSGFSPYWHNGNGPVARSGIGSGAFSGCTSLESLTFEAGGAHGSFAYWVSGADVFSGCTALKSLVYEGMQAYWGNPETSMQNGGFRDIWSADYNNIDAPSYYYAVDYYATEDDANAADKTGSTRLARVEYLRGTSTAAIATGDAPALTAQTADRELYAQSDADGVIPDPDEAAAAAGLEGTGWIWRLDDTQYRRGELSESCHAYLAKKDNLSNAHLESTQTEALYLQADRNLSQGTALCPESPFDVERYTNDDDYSMAPLAGEVSPYYTYDPTTGELDNGFQAVLADGTVLGATQYTTRYQRYSSADGNLEEVRNFTSGGAYLITITAGEASGYAGSFSEWILVQSRTGKLVEAYGSSLSVTENAAKYPYSQTSSLDYSAAPYSVTIGTKDVPSALVASSCAGLVRGALNIDATQTAKKFGFELNRSIYPNGEVQDSSQTLSFTRTTDAPAFAVAVYKRFKNASNRTTYGIESDGYVRSDTAILIPLGHVSKVASVSAYAYAMKAPVFFTKLDGSCSKATLKALKEFSQVKIAGSTTLYSQARLSSLQKRLGDSVALSRIGAKAKTSGAFSLAVADELLAAEAVSYTCATVSDASDPLDCLLALNFTGHEGGITLVSGSTAQSKQIMKRLHKNIGELALVQLYGRSKNNATVVSSKAYESGNAFASIWDSDEDFQNVLDGITITVENVKFSSKTVDPDGETAEKSTSKKGSSEAKRGNTTASPSNTTSAGTAGSTSTTSSSTTSAPSSWTADASQSLENSEKSTHGSDQSEATTETNRPTTQTSTAIDDSQMAATTADETPLWQKALFIVVLLVLCGALIPILRKCR